MRITPLVPRRRCKGGNTTISQTACTTPPKAVVTEICSGLKPKPPSGMGVNHHSGMMTV